jgi:hypothetical protein
VGVSGKLHIHVRAGDTATPLTVKVIGDTLPFYGPSPRRRTRSPGVPKTHLGAPAATCDEWKAASVYFVRLNKMSLWHVYADHPLGVRDPPRLPPSTPTSALTALAGSSQGRVTTALVHGGALAYRHHARYASKPFSRPSRGGQRRWWRRPHSIAELARSIR